MCYNLGHDHPANPRKDQGKFLEGDPLGWRLQMVCYICTWETFLMISQMPFSSMSQVHIDCMVHSSVDNIPDCGTLNDFARNEGRNEEDGRCL